MQTTDPGAETLVDAQPGKADGTDPLAKLYHDRARISSQGIVVTELGKRYSDTLTYDLPDSGVSLVDAWIDGTPDLGIPEGSYTEMSLYRIHKPAETLGHLYIDTNGQDLALEMIRRRKDAGAQVTIYINRSYPVDAGAPDAEVDYVVLVGPKKGSHGQGHVSYDGLRFTIQTP